MKIKLTLFALGMAGMLATCSIPAFGSPTAVLSFTGSTTGGTIIDTTIGAGPVTTFTAVPYNELVVAGAPMNNGAYTLTDTSLSFNTSTDVLTLTGEIPTLAGLSTPTALVTIKLGTGLTGVTDSKQISFKLDLPTDILSISESPTLISDLGLGAYGSSLDGLGVVGTGNPNGSGTYEAISTTLGVGLTKPGVPEPASFLLLGGGLALIAGFRRKLFSAIK